MFSPYSYLANFRSYSNKICFRPYSYLANLGLIPTKYVLGLIPTSKCFRPYSYIPSFRSYSNFNFRSYSNFNFRSYSACPLGGLRWRHTSFSDNYIIRGTQSSSCIVTYIHLCSSQLYKYSISYLSNHNTINKLEPSYSTYKFFVRSAQILKGRPFGKCNAIINFYNIT